MIDDKLRKKVSCDIQEFKEKIVIPYIINYGDIESFYQDILTNEPLTFNTNGCTMVKTLLTTTIIPNYIMGTKQYRSLADECNRIGDKLSNVIYDTDTHNLLIKLHHEIYKRITYEEFTHAHSIVGPLLYKKGVCEGISKMVNYICEMNEIDSKVMIGELEGKGPHAWNQIKIDEEWYNADFTLDLTTSDNKHELFDNFLVDDKTISKTHIFESRSNRCDSSRYDSIYRGPPLRNSIEVRKAIADGIKLNKRTINLTIVNAEKHLSDIEKIMNQELQSQNYSWIHPENTDYIHIFIE
ncbi:MAG: transglutaminase domain-containing protein [Candidatus Methanomethylophilaceae archaeon]